MLEKAGLFALSAFASLPLAAQLAPRDVAEEEIVVTASRSEKPLTQIPNTVTLIGQEDLGQQLNVSGDLSTVLGNLVPSFSPSRQKMTSYGESLRGRDPLYMVDGVPQSNPLRDGSRDTYTIDPLMLERIEVIHGANAIHGLGASGGIINLITKRPSDETRQTLRLESFGQGRDVGESLGYGMNYSFSGRWNDFDLIASAGYRSTGVAYDADGRIVGFDNAQGDTMDSDMLNGFVKAGYEWSDRRLELTLNSFDISGNNDWIAVEGDLAAGVPTTAVEGVMPGEPVSNEVTMLSVNFTDEVFLGHDLRMQGFVQDFAGTYGGGAFASFADPAFGGDVFDQSQNNSEKAGVKLTLVRDLARDVPVSIVYGLDYLSDRTFQRLVLTGRNWVPETNYENYALFAQGEYAGERLTATAGVRYEDARLEVEEFTTLYAYNGGQLVRGGAPDFSESLFNIGATYTATDTLRVFANYSEGFSMPDVGRVLRGIDVPGQDVETFLNLTPIVTENTEIGIEYAADAVSAQLAYYTSDADFGQRLEADADGIYSIMRERTEIDGIELRTEWFATDADTFGLRYARTEGRYDSDGDNDVDSDLSGANATPDRVNVSWDRNWSNLVTSRLQVNHLLDRDFEDAAGAVAGEFDGYTIVDVSVDVETRSGLFAVGLHNLTNEDYFTYYSQTLGSDGRNFKGVGRTLRLSYNRRF